jgi:DNA-binding response OmpR family regulator
MARILVIDDDVLLSQLLKEHLTQEGFEVTSASLAAEGLEKALTNPPDLIMLDVMLPDATGYQTCGTLRKNPQTHFVPIIMMSSAARHPGQQSLGRLMGANDYMLKPLDLTETGDRVHSLIGDIPPVRKTPPPPAPPRTVAPAPQNAQQAMGYVTSRLILEPPSARLFDDPPK